jgi:hypothetical protein
LKESKRKRKGKDGVAGAREVITSEELSFGLIPNETAQSEQFALIGPAGDAASHGCAELFKVALFTQARAAALTVADDTHNAKRQTTEH